MYILHGHFMAGNLSCLKLDMPFGLCHLSSTLRLLSNDNKGWFTIQCCTMCYAVSPLHLCSSQCKAMLHACRIDLDPIHKFFLDQEYLMKSLLRTFFRKLKATQYSARHCKPILSTTRAMLWESKFTSNAESHLVLYCIAYMYKNYALIKLLYSKETSNFAILQPPTKVFLGMSHHNAICLIFCKNFLCEMLPFYRSAKVSHHTVV